MVELAFNITTKIRLEPDILPAWFKTVPTTGQQRFDRDADEHDKFEGKTQRADFPLFYILMDYIHHEGKIGDFARTGLLYVIEAASNSTALEQWIVESDLSTLMATGLGALYSQLSRKLVIDHLPDDLPPILALSDYQHPQSNYEIVSSCSEEFQSHLETFLSHLLFWQDVLNHCKSLEVKSTLLEHFQVIFLQQLLYPSLLESSDIDGGSSVAVLTYLRRILESLEHPDMINLILHYLLDLPENLTNKPPPLRTSISFARQRKSVDLATMIAEKSEQTVTPLLFNLVDLILACLRSRNQQTIHVTLQLISAILKRHHRYAVITMLKTDILPVDSVHRTIGAHEQEIEYLMCLAGSFGSQAQFDETYDNVLKDTMARLESHPCSLKLIAPRVTVGSYTPFGVGNSIPGAPRDVREHTLRPDDPLLNAMLDILETFFINPIETNLSVTETIVNLSVCGYMSIEGWLARNPQKYVYDEDEEEADAAQRAVEDEPLASLLGSTASYAKSQDAERLRRMDKCRRRPQWTQSSLPRALDILKRLADQIDSYKSEIPRFEELIQQRWEAFQRADMIFDQPPPPPVRKGTPGPGPGQQDTPTRPSFEELSRSGSPTRPTAIEGLAQRLLSELGTPSRAASPKGRRDQARSSGSATPSGMLASPKLLPLPPKDLPPLPYEAGRSGISSPTKEEMAARLKEEAANAKKQAELAAIDQSILARKIGLPEEVVTPVPLSYEQKEPMSEPLVVNEGKAKLDKNDVSEEEEEEEDDDDEDEEDDDDEGEDAKSRARTETTVSETSTNEVERESSESESESESDEEDESSSDSDDEIPETPSARPAAKAAARKSASAAAGANTPSKKPLASSVKAAKTTRPVPIKATTSGDSTPRPTAKSMAKSPVKSTPIPMRKKPLTTSTTSDSEPASPTHTPSTSSPSSPTTHTTTHSKPSKSHSRKHSNLSHVSAPSVTSSKPSRSSDESSRSSTLSDDDDDEEEREPVSVSHVITNVIIYQSFLFELASLLQVRAGMFNEVRYV